MSLIIRLIKHKYYYGLRKKIDYLNEELRQGGLPTYQYSPKTLPDDTILPWLVLRPSDLDYLKFVAAKLRENPKWTPGSDFINQKIPFDLKQKFIAEKKSHLICHANYYGEYVPLDFQDLPLPPHFFSSVGSSIGSSINLCNELKEIGGRLKLNLGSYTPDLELLHKQRFEELENDLIGFEKMLLLYLYNFSLASIKHHLIIEFG